LYKTRATLFSRGLSIAPCQETPKEPIAAGQTCTNDRRKRFAEGRRTTAPIEVVTRCKAPRFATKNAPNLEADPGTQAPSKSLSWRFFPVRNRSAEIMDNWSP